MYNYTLQLSNLNGKKEYTLSSHGTYTCTRSNQDLHTCILYIYKYMYKYMYMWLIIIIHHDQTCGECPHEMTLHTNCHWKVHYMYMYMYNVHTCKCTEMGNYPISSSYNLIKMQWSHYHPGFIQDIKLYSFLFGLNCLGQNFNHIFLH